MTAFEIISNKPFSESFSSNISATVSSIICTHRLSRVSSTTPDLQVLIKHPSCQTALGTYLEWGEKTLVIVIANELCR